MATIGSIAIGMTVNTAQFKSGLEKGTRAVKSFGNSASAEAEGGIAKLQKSIDGIGRTARAGLGIAQLRLVGDVAGAAGGAVVDFLGKGISSAMDLGETMAKTGEVFGSSSAAIITEADAMSRAFGLNKQELLDGASAFGQMAKAAGQSEGQAAQLSGKMAKLAADLSSIQNIPVADALAKIRSGLSGEAEPLKQFGVLMTEDAVKAEAMRLGIVKNAKAIDEKAKIVARASIIERDLAYASGDLVRTQDSAANQFRKTQGIIDNFATTIGASLLPYVTAAAVEFNALAVSVTDSLGSKSVGALEAVAMGVATIADLAQAASVALTAMGTLWTQIAMQYSPLQKQPKWLEEKLVADGAILDQALNDKWSAKVAEGFARIRDGAKASNVATKDLTASIMTGAGAMTSALGGLAKASGIKSAVTENVDAIEKMKAAGRALYEELQTPAEKFTAEMKKLQDLKIGGFIDPTTFDRGAAAAKKKLDEATEKDRDKADAPRFAGAFKAGSTESYSAITQARGVGGRGDKINDVAANTRKLTEQQERTIKAVESAATSLKSFAGKALDAAVDFAF